MKINSQTDTNDVISHCYWLIVSGPYFGSNGSPWTLDPIMDLFMKSKQFKKMTLIHSTTGMINVVRMLLLERSWFEVYLHKKDIEVASFFILYHTKTIIRTESIMDDPYHKASWPALWLILVKQSWIAMLTVSYSRSFFHFQVHPENNDSSHISTSPSWSKGQN